MRYHSDIFFKLVLIVHMALLVVDFAAPASAIPAVFNCVELQKQAHGCSHKIKQWRRTKAPRNSRMYAKHRQTLRVCLRLLRECFAQGQGARASMIVAEVTQPPEECPHIE